MSRRKFATTVCLDPEQVQQLRLLSMVVRRPMAEIVREGIDLVLANNHNKAPRRLDLFNEDEEKKPLHNPEKTP